METLSEVGVKRKRDQFWSSNYPAKRRTARTNCPNTPKRRERSKRGTLKGSITGPTRPANRVSRQPVGGSRTTWEMKERVAGAKWQGGGSNGGKKIGFTKTRLSDVVGTRKKRGKESKEGDKLKVHGTRQTRVKGEAADSPRCRFSTPQNFLSNTKVGGKERTKPKGGKSHQGVQRKLN